MRYGGMMRREITRFKNLHIPIKELERFIKNPETLQTGKPFKRFGDMRPRELLANWLLCVVLNFGDDNNEYSLISDYDGGDGIIFNDITKMSCNTEHIIIPECPENKEKDIDTLILNAINKKRNKGKKAYASGKTLIVFLNSGGNKEWFPDKIAKKLPQPLYFDAVWVVGLYKFEFNKYTYGVSWLNLDYGYAPMYLIHINEDFTDWTVERIQ